VPRGGPGAYGRFLAYSGCPRLRCSAENAGRLADLNQVPIRVANVRPDLASMVLRLREELRAVGRPFLVDLVDVRDADVEELARAARVGRRRESDGGLVVCGAAADIEDQPRVRNLHDDRVALQENLPVEQRPIELTGPVLIGNHEKVSYDEAVLGGWKLVRVHLAPPLVRS